MPFIEYLLAGAAVLLLLSIIASKVSDKLGIPALLIFLVVGMLAGSDGPGGIHFDDPFSAATDGGNGFLAVYISGLVMGNRNFIHKNSLKRFHDGLAWLMQISMFLVLGLLVFPSRLVHVIGEGLAVSLLLMMVARPAGVFLITVLSGMTIREKTMVSWVGLRGAVPIILATFPLLAGIPKADMIFNMVFFIVLSSALLQGTTIPVIAKWLKVDAPIPVKPVYPIECAPTEKMKCDLTEIVIPENSAAGNKRLYKEISKELNNEVNTRIEEYR